MLKVDGIVILILITLATGIWIGFLLGFSKAMREAAARLAKPGKPVGGRIFLTAGILSLITALGFSIHSIHFSRNAARAKGQVLELREHHDKDQDTTYSPVVSFRHAGGSTHLVESHSSSSPPSYHIGDTVPVIYPSRNPEDAKIDEFMEVCGAEVVCSSLGLIFILAGLASLYSGRIKQRFWPCNGNATAN
jgi:hypothetical protein